MEHEQLVGYTKGEALAFSEADAWTTWRKMHARSKGSEQAWLEDVLSIETKVRTWHAGRMQIIVSVEARKTYEREGFVYGWAAAPHSGYQLKDKA